MQKSRQGVLNRRYHASNPSATKPIKVTEEGSGTIVYLKFGPIPLHSPTMKKLGKRN